MQNSLCGVLPFMGFIEECVSMWVHPRTHVHLQALSEGKEKLAEVDSGAQLGQDRRGHPVTVDPLVPLAFEPCACIIKTDTEPERRKERAEMKPKRGRMLIVGSGGFYGGSLV